MYRRTRAEKRLAISAIGLALVLACVTSASGQTTEGDTFKMTLNGSFGVSYEDSFGSNTDSNHGLGMVANGTLDGYYYNPNFLAFQVRPYYDRSATDSESQSITRGSGVDSSIRVFGGSHFPGLISYGKDFSSDSEFSIAGVPSVLGNSSGTTFSIGWGALFDGLPKLYANYQVTDSTSTLLDTTSQSKSLSKNFNLSSNYDLAGFILNGNLNHYNTDFQSPSFLTAAAISDTSSNTNYSVTANRLLPLSGSLGLGWSRTTSENGSSDSSTDSYTASASFVPWRRLAVSESFNYTTNLIAALAQSLGGGNISPFLNNGSNSNAMYMDTVATLLMGNGLDLSAYLNHRIEHFQGSNIEDTQFGGSFNFRKANHFLGFLYFSVGLVDTATQEGNSGAGLIANLGMTHKFGLWETSADFSYSQDVQTLLALVTTSNYNFGGTLRRKINPETYWSASFRESRSGLTSQQGNNNSSESFTTSLSWKKHAFSGSYSRSIGAALLSANGTLTATPLGSIISNEFLTFDARSFGVNASTLLFRRVTVSGGYAKVSSDTLQQSLGTYNHGDHYYARLDLRLRKLLIQSGFDRAIQQASVVPGGPQVVNTFFVSLSRWFKLF